MSQVKQKLQDDLKVAMKSKDVFKRDTIRLLMSALKQVEVDERRELSDDDIYKIIQKSIKQRDDSATQFKAAGRDELYQKEVNEAQLLKDYLPKQLSENELKNIITNIIKDNNASDLKDMGKVMKLTTKEIGSTADGKTISQIVRQLLSSN